jgi:hypothetical protein
MDYKSALVAGTGLHWSHGLVSTGHMGWSALVTWFDSVTVSKMNRSIKIPIKLHIQ